MIIIEKDISQKPYYTETTSMAISAQPLSAKTYSSACPLPCPAMAISTTPKQSPTKRQKRRKVGFGPEVTLAYIESAFDFTQDEKDERWYRTSTISGFKEDARRLCRGRIDDVRNGCSPRVRVRKSLAKNNSNSNNIPSNSSNEKQRDLSHDSIRGLDVYAPSRQRFTKKYIQHVLEAYHVRCVGNDEHVALLAEKWSKKSLTRAINMGEKDFLAAYFSKEVDEESLLEKPLLTQQQQVPKILASLA